VRCPNGDRTAGARISARFSPRSTVRRALEEQGHTRNTRNTQRTNTGHFAWLDVDDVVAGALVADGRRGWACGVRVGTPATLLTYAPHALHPQLRQVRQPSARCTQGPAHAGQASRTSGRAGARGTGRSGWSTAWAAGRATCHAADGCAVGGCALGVRRSPVAVPGVGIMVAPPARVVANWYTRSSAPATVYRARVLGSRGGRRLAAGGGWTWTDGVAHHLDGGQCRTGAARG
jgi:hypothetical protein